LSSRSHIVDARNVDPARAYGKASALAPQLRKKNPRGADSEAFREWWFTSTRPLRRRNRPPLTLRMIAASHARGEQLLNLIRITVRGDPRRLHASLTPSQAYRPARATGPATIAAPRRGIKRRPRLHIYKRLRPVPSYCNDRHRPSLFHFPTHVTRFHSCVTRR